MAGVNKVILIGNLGKDPELRYTPNGQPVASFSLATTERWNDKNNQKQEKTEWHNIVVWGKLGELANQYLKKGRSAYIEGRITTRSWDDRDGNKKYRTEIVANQIQFLGGNQGGGDGSATSEPAQVSDPQFDQSSAPEQNASAQNASAQNTSAQNTAANDDLPF
ncbi:MAG: single-stranded DNA-binding protein [Chitinivibrionales bacterium]